MSRWCIKVETKKLCTAYLFGDALLTAERVDLQKRLICRQDVSAKEVQEKYEQ